MPDHSCRQDLPENWAHPIRAVAFDMDGLLVNTEDLYTEVGNTLMERRGKVFSRELKNAMTGLPGPEAFAVMIEWQKLIETPEELAQESREIFAGLLPAKLKLLVGVGEMLDQLDARALPRCVATSSTRTFAEKVLQIIGFTDRFDFVITAADVPNGKPHPDIYQAAAERMAVETREMMVLEDSHHGSRAGVRAGACTIAVPGSHSEDHDFEGVHFRANTLADPGITRILVG